MAYVLLQTLKPLVLNNDFVQHNAEKTGHHLTHQPKYMQGNGRYGRGDPLQAIKAQGGVAI
jgi:hypothetical protein